jgi:hypothetical protein
LKNSKTIIEQTTAVVSEWEKYAKDAGVPTGQSKALKKAHRLKIK